MAAYERVGLRPGVAAAGAFAGAVKESGDRLVGHQPGEGPDEVRCLAPECPTVPIGLVLADLQLGMVAALPVDDEIDLVALDTGHNHDRPQNAFAGCRSGRRVVPGPLEIGTECHQLGPFFRCHRRLALVVQGNQPVFEMPDGKQPLVPTPLELGGDKPVVGIDGIVLTTGAPRFVSYLVKRKLRLSLLLLCLPIARLDRLDSGLDAKRPQQPENLRRDRLIHAQRTEGDASVAAVIEVSTSTVISADGAIGAAVAE